MTAAQKQRITIHRVLGVHRRGGWLGRGIAAALAPLVLLSSFQQPAFAAPIHKPAPAVQAQRKAASARGLAARPRTATMPAVAAKPPSWPGAAQIDVDLSTGGRVALTAGGLPVTAAALAPSGSQKRSAATVP